MRDITLEDTIYIAFTTRAFATGIPTVLSGSPVVSAYEDAGLTQITAGITLGVDHDGVVGLNMLTIVTTAANGYESGKDYNLVITTGTVGGVSVVGEVIGQFTIGRSAAAVDLANGTDGLGAIKTDTASILVDTADMQPRVVAIEIDTGTTLDGKIDTIDTIVDAIKAVTDLLPDAGALTAIGIDTARLTAVRAAVLTDWINGGRLDLILDIIAADVVNIDGDAMRGTEGANTDKTGYALSATGADLILKTSTFALALADAVWDEVVSKAAHDVAQSAAKVLRQGGDLIQIDGVVSDASPTTTDFDTNLTQIDTFFNDSIMIFSNGSANAGIGKPISSYVNASGHVTFIGDLAWPVTPVNGDDFVIVALHEHPIAELQSGLATEAKQDIIDTNVDAILVDTNELQSDDVPGLIAALNDISAVNVLTQVNAALDTAIAELGVAAPTATPTLRTGVILLYMALRNKLDITATTKEIHNDAGTKIAEKTLSDDGTTYSETELA